jgi:hypothetical protein
VTGGQWFGTTVRQQSLLAGPEPWKAFTDEQLEVDRLACIYPLGSDNGHPTWYGPTNLVQSKLFEVSKKYTRWRITCTVTPPIIPATPLNDGSQSGNAYPRDFLVVNVKEYPFRYSSNVLTPRPGYEIVPQIATAFTTNDGLIVKDLNSITPAQLVVFPNSHLIGIYGHPYDATDQSGTATNKLCVGDARSPYFITEGGSSDLFAVYRTEPPVNETGIVIANHTSPPITAPVNFHYAIGDRFISPYTWTSIESITGVVNYPYGYSEPFTNLNTCVAYLTTALAEDFKIQGAVKVEVTNQFPPEYIGEGVQQIGRASDVFTVEITVTIGDAFVTGGGGRNPNVTRTDFAFQVEYLSRTLFNLPLAPSQEIKVEIENRPVFGG